MKGKGWKKEIVVGALIIGSLFMVGQMVLAQNIFDSSFEESEIGQKPKYWDQGVVVDNEKHSGGKAVMLTTESSGEKKTMVYRYTSVINPTPTYRLGIAAKVNNLQITGYSTRLEFRLAGTKTPVFALTVSPPVDVWQGWRVYEGVFKPEEHGIYTQTEVEIILERSGVAGTAWFDDVSIEEIRSPSPRLLLCSYKVEPGAVFTLQGTGFPFPGNVEVFLASQKIASAKTQSTDGYFETQITIPTGTTPGTYVLRAKCQAWEPTTSIEVVVPAGDLKITGADLNSNSSLNDGWLSSGEVLKVRITATGGCKAVCTVEALVEFSLTQQPGLELYEADWRPSDGVKTGQKSVSIKLTKGSYSLVKEIGRLSINTIKPVVKPFEGPSVVKNGESFTLRVKVEPLAENYQVNVDFSPLDTTKGLVSLDYCRSCATAGVYEKSIYISPSNSRTDGAKTLLATAIDTIGNKGTAEIVITLDNKGGAGQGPKIVSLTFAPEKVLANQEVEITLIGESGAKAKAFVGDREITLQEQTPPGTYKGKFSPGPGIDLKEATVKAELTKDSKTSGIEAAKKLNINTVVPAITAASVADFDNKYFPGEEVHIIVKGTTGSEVSIELSAVGLSALKLKEDATGGFYRGSFLVGEAVALGEKILPITITAPSGNNNSAKIVILVEGKPQPKEEIVEQKIKIPKGISILILTINPGDGWRLSDLAKAIGSNFQMFIWYNRTEEKFASYLSSMPENSPTNKEIGPGDGYIVVMKEAVEIVLKGKPWPMLAAAPQSELVCLLQKKIEEMEATDVVFQNYPNPGNPETWIPYQLREPAEVLIRIYNTNGQLVRTLCLGHRSAGLYIGRAKAAYWDGRDNSGQKVASGVYFYTLQAGCFSTTRKMVVKK